MVVDGTDHAPFDEHGEVLFTQDSRHTVYVARRGKSWLIVVDGAEGRTAYDGFLPRPTVVLDGPRRFHALAVRRGEFLRVECELPAP